jgi:hypothetical protein
LTSLGASRRSKSLLVSWSKKFGVDADFVGAGFAGDDFEGAVVTACSAVVAAGTETTSPHRHFTFFPIAVSGTFNDTPQLEHFTMGIDVSSFCKQKTYHAMRTHIRKHQKLNQ